MLKVVSLPADADKSTARGCWQFRALQLTSRNILADTRVVFNSDGLTGTEKWAMTIQHGQDYENLLACQIKLFCSEIGFLPLPM